jgi:hypothetical protein
MRFRGTGVDASYGYLRRYCMVSQKPSNLHLQNFTPGLCMTRLLHASYFYPNQSPHPKELDNRSAPKTHI